MSVPTGFVLGWVLALLSVASALFAMVGLAAWVQHRQEVPGRRRRRAEQAEWAEHAAALVDRSRQADDRVATARAELAAAEHHRAAAWQELEQAQTDHDAVARRYEEARQRAGAPADPAGRQELTRAAFAAYRRGDLSQEQLWRVWELGSGWGPELAERERELVLLRSQLRAAHSRYRSAASRERAAAAELEVAQVQQRALAEEAATAADRAGWHDDPDEQRSPQAQ